MGGAWSESRLWLNPLLRACALIRTASGIVMGGLVKPCAFLQKMHSSGCEDIVLPSSLQSEGYRACFHAADTVWPKLILGKAETRRSRGLCFTKHVLASPKSPKPARALFLPLDTGEVLPPWVDEEHLLPKHAKCCISIICCYSLAQRILLLIPLNPAQTLSGKTFDTQAPSLTILLPYNCSCCK